MAVFKQILTLINLDAQIQRGHEAQAGEVDSLNLTQEPPIWQLTKQSGVTFLDDNAIWTQPLFVTNQGPRTSDQMANETALRRHQSAFTG